LSLLKGTLDEKPLELFWDIFFGGDKTSSSFPGDVLSRKPRWLPKKKTMAHGFQWPWYSKENLEHGNIMAAMVNTWIKPPRIGGR
jgi:hypothetical protein